MKTGLYTWDVSRIVSHKLNGKEVMGPECWRLNWTPTSKYTPHQGKKECARRVRNEI